MYTFLVLLGFLASTMAVAVLTPVPQVGKNFKINFQNALQAIQNLVTLEM
jgi:hypothetical protein